MEFIRIKPREMADQYGAAVNLQLIIKANHMRNTHKLAVKIKLFPMHLDPR